MANFEPDGPDREPARSDLESTVIATERHLRDAERELAALKDTTGYRLLSALRAALRRLAPADSLRGATLASILRGIDMIQIQGWVPFLTRLAMVHKWAPRILRRDSMPPPASSRRRKVSWSSRLGGAQRRALSMIRDQGWRAFLHRLLEWQEWAPQIFSPQFRGSEAVSIE